ncbi:hypothetical protein ACFOUP_06890 [Belliella kenyensis]|uniref:Uncharacterized protein n=1 Tax=Belliella kenyensis TaxID=1472724 RepID=A0ABV8EJL9_9BACT|nr:hypothetical protein [Belliella kenyensis]MCH7401213.1 hypothetical protein [Belliella kenyensis]MDN3602659.1 hypothetical protein [Belliella kenyensis]
MRQNYKPLGKDIQPASGRKSDLEDLPLVGLSIQKKFIPSIANTIGTDMSTFRIIERNQFAYDPVTSRNGEKNHVSTLTKKMKGKYSKCKMPFDGLKFSNSLFSLTTVSKKELCHDIFVFFPDEFFRWFSYNPKLFI